MSNLGGIKTAVLEETHLLGAFLCISGLASKFFASGIAREFIPIDLGSVQGTAYQCLFHAARFQFLLDTSRPVTACGPTANENIGVALVFLQSFVSQVIKRVGNIVVLESFCAELAFKLAAAVFTPRKRADRQVARAASRLVAQASSNSSRSSSTALAAAAALDVIATARILASISAAILGLSFRYCRTLSLPCPIRSPL